MRINKAEKLELLGQLNWLERKNKFNRMWDNQVKIMFTTSGSFSFEELIIKDAAAAEQLIVLFK
jgi:hypothetical protein